MISNQKIIVSDVVLWLSIIGSLTILFGLFISLSAQRQVGAIQSVYIDDLDINGDIAVSEKRVVKKRIQNDGKVVVKVTGLVVSCSCMGALNLPLEVAPGKDEYLEIGVGANPQKYSVGDRLSQEYSLLVEASGNVHAISGRLDMRVVQ